MILVIIAVKGEIVCPFLWPRSISGVYTETLLGGIKFGNSNLNLQKYLYANKTVLQYKYLLFTKYIYMNGVIAFCNATVHR
jgi:hypothetical protein